MSCVLSIGTVPSGTDAPLLADAPLMAGTLSTSVASLLVAAPSMAAIRCS